MKPRLRLPAYGKQLLNERRQGRHPLVVHVVYGEQMHHGTRCDLDCAGGFEPEKMPTRVPAGAGDPHPHLWVRPSEFRPWTIDWHAVIEAAVCVFDLREDHLVGSRNFYELLGELGRFAGPVQVYRLEPYEVVGDCVVSRWEFYSAAHVGPVEDIKLGKDWPFYWPIETERENARRREKWGRLNAARLEQRAAIAA